MNYYEGVRCLAGECGVCDRLRAKQELERAKFIIRHEQIHAAFLNRERLPLPLRNRSPSTDVVVNKKLYELASSKKSYAQILNEVRKIVRGNGKPLVEPRTVKKNGKR
jgi:hypothetical protein